MKASVEGSLSSRIAALTRRGSFVLGLAVLPVVVVDIIAAISGVVSLSADDHSRVLHAASWAKAPFLFETGTIWLPGHAYLLGLALSIHYDLLVTPRIFTALFSLLGLAGIYLISRSLFNSSVACLSVLLMGLLPFYVRLTVTPLSDMVYYTLILWFLYCFITWWKERNNGSLLLAALLLSFCCAIRYEAWLTAAFFSLCLTRRLISERKESRLSVLLWLILIGLVGFGPCVWTIKNFVSWGDPFHFVRATFPGSVDTTGPLSKISPKLGYLDLLFENGALVCILAVVGVVLLDRPVSKVIRWYLVLSLAPLGMLTLLMKSPEVWAAYKPRYVGQYLIALVPFCAYAIYWALTIGHRVGVRWHRSGWVMVVLMSLYNLWLVYLRLVVGASSILLESLLLIGVFLSYLLFTRKDWLFVSLSLIPLTVLMAISKYQLLPTAQVRKCLTAYFVLLFGISAWWAWKRRSGTGALSVRQLRAAGVGILVILTISSLWGDLTGIPAQSAGVEVGLRIRRLFMNGTLQRGDKILLQVDKWNYLEMQVMSNHPESFIFDRSPNLIGSRARESFLLDDCGQAYEVGPSLIDYKKSPKPQTGGGLGLQQYLEAQGIGLVVVKDPRLRALLDQQPCLTGIDRVSGYCLYSKRGNHKV